MNAESVSTRFHRSLYLSMALACACLAYADRPFLPEMPAVAAAVGILMLVAYRLEGRWALSIRAANAVGAGIGILVIGWIVFQFMRPWESPIDNLPWPTSLLPYLGPPVLILIPSKLLRPKHHGDYWGFIGIGLMAVALACSLAGDGLFGLLLLAYGLSVVTLLTRFHRYRIFAVASSLEQAPSARHRQRSASSFAAASSLEQAPGEKTVFRSVGRHVAIAAIAVGSFLLTPRFSESQWELPALANRLQVGFSEKNPGIDLNQSGTLNPTNEIAFEVRAETADGQPKLDLSPTQRWRGATFNYYDQGRWSNRSFSSAIEGAFTRRGRPSERMVRATLPRPQANEFDLPDLGPQQFFLTFPGPSKGNHALVLADPVWPGTPYRGWLLLAPVMTISEHGGDRYIWNANREGDIFPALPGKQHKARYRQVTAPTPEPDLSPPLDVDAAFAEHHASLAGLPDLHRYTANLVGRMIESGRVPASQVSEGAALSSENHESVARAIQAHLANSGVFQYSLDLKHIDRKMDPVEDFVLNVRAGHCNRFATALALMLRCQGIPSRVVLGFRGCESKKGDGAYIVRQSDAHSWVEALIRRRGPDGGHTWHWLTLDPTPFLERAEENEGHFGRWIDDMQRGTAELFKSFVIDYNADQQARAKQILTSVNPLELFSKVPLRHIPALAVSLALLLFCGLIAVNELSRRRARTTRRTAYARFLTLCSRWGLLTPRDWMTPREAVAAFAHAVESRADAAELVAAASRIADEHYATRFGGLSRSINSREELQFLTTALRQRSAR